MAIPTKEHLIHIQARLLDRLITGTILPEVALFAQGGIFRQREPGELHEYQMWGFDHMPWGIFNPEEYDDGGGPAIAAIRFRKCT